MLKLTVLLIVAVVPLGWGAECPGPKWIDGLGLTMDYLKTTDEVSLTVGSAEGAAGDVVAVTLYLDSQLAVKYVIGFDVAVCHDPDAVELVGLPIYSEEFLEMGGLSMLAMHVDETSGRVGHKGFGFFLHAFITRAYDERLPSDIPLPVMTLFYRLRAKPGVSTSIRLCDGELQFGLVDCAVSGLSVRPPEKIHGDYYLPNVKIDGTLTVVEGPVTHPDRPPEPPEAIVYPDKPTTDGVNFRVRITGANAEPGDRNVVVDVYATADYEYTGLLIPIDYDERYLRLTRADEHFLAGLILENPKNQLPEGGPEEGNLIVTSGFGVNSYRIAAEGEEVHAATLYFDVLEGAKNVDATELRVVPVTTVHGIIHAPWVGVRYVSGVGVEDPLVRSEIAPIAVQNGTIELGGKVLRGDANKDGALDVSDVVGVLDHLFLGKPEPRCPHAADFNLDQTLDVSDPVSLLSFLFLGGPFGPEGAPSEVTCRLTAGG